jgi:hypothetical protein
MTLNIPFHDIMLNNEDIDDNGDDFMKEIAAAADSNENTN